jgi:predicted metal-dependent phosphotriesterase family hydrolase
MSTVQTVRGPVDAGELGTTLMHEHVFIMQPEALQNWGHAFGPVYWDEDERLDDAVAKLNAVRDAGIRTIVDPTAPGLGRYVPRLQTLNRAVDLNIVVATGYGNRIHLSHDAACFMDFMVGDPAFANEKPDYLLISNRVVPALLDAGVTQAQIDEMMVTNPRRFLTGEHDTAVAGAAALSGSAPHRSR